MLHKPVFKKIFSPLTWSFVAMIGMSLVGLFVLFSVGQVGVSQDIRQQASTNDAKIELSFRADKTTLAHDQTVFVDVLINTFGQSISAVSLEGTVQGPVTKVTQSNTSEAGLVTSYQKQTKLNDVLNWNSIVFAAPTGDQLFSTHGSTVKIGTLVIDPSAKGTIVVALDAGKSDVAGQASGATIQYPSSLSLTITDQVGPPDQGIHRSCNEYCADSRECASQFTCYYNRCRNPQNLDNQQCQLPPSPSPRPPAANPKGGVPKNKPTPPAAKIIKDEITNPAPSITTISVNKAATGAGSRPTPTPLPSPSPSPSPTPTPSPSLSPSPSPQSTEESKKGGNVFIIALLVTLLVGGVAGLAFVLIKYRG